MPQKKTVVIGLLGIQKDAGKGAARWEKWRPTIALVSHEDLLVHRFELLIQPSHRELAKQIVSDIRDVSPETEVHLHSVQFEDAWDFVEVYGQLHDFVRGYRFKPESEDYLIHLSTGTHTVQICLFLLTESRHLPARLIQTSPPKYRKHRLSDPGTYNIIDLDLSKYDFLAARFQQEQKEATSFLKSGIETRSKEFNRLIARIEQVAIASRDPLLLMGPTGAGKSRLAKRIYALKKARHQMSGAFVEVNCATIRGDAAMSSLFGHVKGAFTGAINNRDGHLRAANNGVLFLDEIGELGLDEQAMLLRALEDKVFLPLGSDKEVKSDFQLIAGTNRDLSDRVREGKFREDLLARINLWTFCLPGLRERKEDIEPNLQFELDQFAERNGRRVTFSREALTRFLKFATSPDASWNGNFRDLNGAIIRMATLAEGGRISVEVVQEEIERLQESWQQPRTNNQLSCLEQHLHQDALDDLDLFDRMQLESVIKVCQSSRSLSEAGRKLFHSSRDRKQTVNDADRLRKYLLRFGLSWERVREGGKERQRD
ncbi:MAG: RNA repair transcriptional activator RtcR [Acidobacteria bacterium]|nr:RNA repair transcriptional activator RtcR [Acidobacteriota bacterium]